MIDCIGIIAHEGKKDSLIAARKAFEYITAAGAKACLSEDTAKALQMNGNEQDFALAKCLLVVGGDGTILRSAKVAIEYNIPIVGVNFGRVGFLSEVEPENLLPAIDSLLAGDFREESRAMLEAEFEGKRSLALNDVLLCKMHHSRTIEIEASINGKKAAQCSCDGILVSTPTGSTAYSLSAGGPIVSPELPSILITPVCPHTISARPIVVGDKDIVEIKLVQDHFNKAQVCVDGELLVEEFGKGQVLSVRTSKQRLKFLRIGDSNYFELIHRKIFDA